VVAPLPLTLPDGQAVHAPTVPALTANVLGAQAVAQSMSRSQACLVRPVERTGADERCARAGAIAARTAATRRGTDIAGAAAGAVGAVARGKCAKRVGATD
jgi:hypothetical protein